MELRQCRYFVAVVDAKSITSAARKLHVVQSAVSHQVARLEEELQAMLLERTRSGVVPTEAGRLPEVAKDLVARGCWEGAVLV